MDLVKQVHEDDTLHGGIKKTKFECNRQFYYWGLEAVVETVCASCMQCQGYNADYFGPVDLCPIYSLRPMERLQGDFISLPQTAEGFNCICKFTDHMSKYAWALACKGKTSGNVEVLLESIAQINIGLNVPKNKVF